MDYVTNSNTIVETAKSGSIANLLAYDVAFAKLKNEQRKEKKHV